MANIKTYIDEKTGITYIVAEGKISLGSSLTYFNSQDFKRRTDKIIYDVRLASHADVSVGNSAKLTRSVKPLSRPNLRVAFVFAKGEDFRKGRAFKAQLEASSYDMSYQIFTDIDKAEAWVMANEKQ